MDYDALRTALSGAVPFNGYLGLEVVEVGDGTAVVRLPDSDNLKNHVGSQHAGALFSAGEAASGGAFLGAFAEHMGGITALARSASVRYTKIASGAVDARGRLDADKDDLLSRLEADGRIEFSVEVELVDGDGNQVATMTVDWHVRRNG